MCCTKELTVSGVESFPGELDTLRADNVRLRRLLQLSEEQARAAASDQATLTGAPDSPVTMGSSSAEKVRFFFELFRCRTDVYALRWENRRDGRSRQCSRIRASLPVGSVAFRLIAWWRLTTRAWLSGVKSRGLV